MESSNEYPPNYSEILVAFSDIEKFKPIFAYGDTIYNPFKRAIPADIVFHESIHMRQQGNYPDIWWNQYLNNEEFRLNQELEAYGEQYAFVVRNIPSNKMNKAALFSMAQALSGESYGSLLSFSEAESKIKKYAKDLRE